MNLSAKDLKCRDLVTQVMGEMIELSTPRGHAMRKTMLDERLDANARIMFIAFCIECGAAMEASVSDAKLMRRWKQVWRVHDACMEEFVLLQMPVEGHA